MRNFKLKNRTALIKLREDSLRRRDDASTRRDVRITNELQTVQMRRLTLPAVTSQAWPEIEPTTGWPMHSPAKLLSTVQTTDAELKTFTEASHSALRSPERRLIAIFASCGSYIFRNFTYETKIIMSEYVVPQRFFIDIKTDDLEWPWIAILR